MLYFVPMKPHCAKPAFLFAMATICCGFFASCSVSLTKYDLQEYPKTVTFFEPIELTFGDKTSYLDSNLQNAYSAAIDTTFYPMGNCRGTAHISAKVVPDNETSDWGIGAAFIPLWPALPVSESWHYHMDVQILCNGALAFSAEFEESEHVEAFWFGRMRADLVNDASQEMHRKLIERLKFETQMGRYTDLNSAQDF